MSDRAGEGCAECGATGRFGSCPQLFETLLALDHQRLQPWGRFHGLNVACYLLQHPSQAIHGVHLEHLELVTAYLEGGLAAVTELERRRVRLNRNHRLPTSKGPAPPLTNRPVCTIVDVSVDGTFPADGYEERMQRWANSAHWERRQS